MPSSVSLLTEATAKANAEPIRQPEARIAALPTSPSDITPVPAAQVPAADGEMVLQAPGNSTLELRVARRPWLLDKLMNPGGSDAEKMDPPSPPAELPDPPSLGRLPARPSYSNESIDVGVDPNDGWRTRGQISVPRLNAVDQQPTLRAVEPTQEASMRAATNGVPLLAAPQTTSPQATSPRVAPSQAPLRSVAPSPADGPIPLTDPPAMKTRNSRPASPKVVEPTTPAESPAQSAEPKASQRVSDLPSKKGIYIGDDSDNEPPRQSPNESSGVVVRKLRIGRDGMPLGNSDSLAPFDHEMEDALPIGAANDAKIDPPSYVKPIEKPTEKPVASPPTKQKPLQTVEPEILGADSDRGKRDLDRDENREADVGRSDTTARVQPSIPLDYAGYPLADVPVGSTVARMQNLMRACLSHYYADAEVANERSNWGMMHAIMVYGIDTKVIVDRKSYSTIAWIAGNNACRGQRLLASENGRIVVKSGVGLQGHQAQMLAVFSLCDVPEDYPLYAGGEKYSMRDVIREEQLACKTGEELTFTLIGLSHYMDTDSSWKSEDGETWDFERLIREELSQPIVGAACGGTHRLMGFAHALRKRRAEGKPIDGQWKRAEKFTEDFVDYSYRLQNRDGSMSTDWFEGREDNDDTDRKVQTTGHMVEWLLTLTPDSQLQNPRLVAAVRYLLTTMYKDRDHDWSIGPKGHALRSLAMYYERVYRADAPPWRTPMTARSPSRSTGNSRR
ncbi:hypothetical protein [Rubripirellula reticaptiva]|uniref:hypothetical protein n=1 Tax=Rubripirellula reticaptiva TaxID=2528013 RepID=UPI0011B5916D|nr:hypothetical protein [Rubripirellula reticaptiva]